MGAIQLNFINQSRDTDNSEIVIFQKNIDTDDRPVVAWKLIKGCGPGNNHLFTFPLDYTVSASDSRRNHTPQIYAQDGDVFGTKFIPEGWSLAPGRKIFDTKQILVHNRLSREAINVYIYKNGKLLASNPGVVPKQWATFEFKPTIWIGAVSQISQGEIMTPQIVKDITTEISLQGIASADIVMTGGGPRPNSQPYKFILENVVKA